MSDMQIVALVGQKGGSGKTTLVQSLAVLAQANGKTVAVIDLDPQATSENWADRRDDDFPVVISAHPPRLPQVIETAREMGVDFLLIDSPGKSEASSLAAAKAAHLVVIPCKVWVNDVETLPATKDILDLAGAKPAFVVINDCPIQGSRHTDAKLSIETREETKGLLVCPTFIFHRNAYGDAPNAGQSVSEYEPKGKAAEEIKLVYNFTIEQLNKATSGGVNGKSNEHSRRAQKVG
jgi:chromosome partitioning protein